MQPVNEIVCNHKIPPVDQAVKFMLDYMYQTDASVLESPVLLLLLLFIQSRVMRDVPGGKITTQGHRTDMETLNLRQYLRMLCRLVVVALRDAELATEKFHNSRVMKLVASHPFNGLLMVIFSSKTESERDVEKEM